MAAKPDFIDNRNDNTLARALGRALGVATDGPGESGQSPDAVRIATAFFSPTGFARVADHLEDVPAVRLLLGADLASGGPDERRQLGESPRAFEQRQMLAGLDRMDDALRRERDRLPFSRPSDVALRKLSAALRRGNMDVRRYEKAFLHAKAYIFTLAETVPGEGEGIIVGSSNLTGAGLTRNLELNLGCRDRRVVAQGQRWFDDLWDEAEPYDLAALFDEVLQSCTPWEIFIRVLWQLYGEEVEEDARNDPDLPLTSFQKHGVARALRLIRDRGGAIVADEVGLGKTFIAGEVMEIYRDRRQRALLVCPAALRDTTWKKFLNRFQLFAEILSFEELANDIQLRDARRPHANQEKLQRSLDEYQLVVVDEAHNYRNPDASTRAAVLRRLLFGRRRDVLLLTATPVNNSLWDIYHLARFFVRQDSQLAELGILSVRERFERAMREDPSSLSPDVLYPIIDATTVKRTRQFVRKHYRGDHIVGSDGKPVPIVFPQPQAISVRYNFDDLSPDLFDHLEQALDPDSDEAIVFARYTPDEWLRADVETEDNAYEKVHARALVGLLRSGLLKRFESSVFAFGRTVKRMVAQHETFLGALEAGYVVTTEFMKELSADDEAAFEDVLAETRHRRDTALYDVKGLRDAVERDRGLLQALADQASAILPDRDPKLRALAEELVAIATQAADEAESGIDEIQRRKVLVFSFFADTVEWIRDFLRTEIDCRPELAGYLDRMVAVSGSDDLAEGSRQQAILGFAPVSMEAPPGHETDLYDLMVSTDVLAEGVNLQQCRHIINFDLPWNPMRLVQRHGRIDRIGSPHSRVFIRTIFPADRLDQLLNLEQRILDKLAMAAASVGVAAPIEGSVQGMQVFTETRDEIEKLLAEDPTLYLHGGPVSAAQTGEEYRQTLRNALAQDRDRIVRLSWKTGSGMAKGDRSGVFFCAVAGSRTYLRFVSANEDWSVSGTENAVVRETGTCLKLIECEPETPTWCPDNLRDRVYDFWNVARQDIWSEWMRETDPANLQPRIRPLNVRVAEFIRTNPPVGMDEGRVTRALDILESPWPRREEVMLRGWFETEERKGAERSRFLVERILETGLEPVEPPPLLPPIELEDIEVLCWMLIDGTGEERTRILPTRT